MLVCKRLYNTREQAAHDELGDISAILLLSSSLKSHNCLISCIAAQRFSCFIVQLDMFSIAMTVECMVLSGLVCSPLRFHYLLLFPICGQTIKACS